MQFYSFFLEKANYRRELVVMERDLLSF